ncbi:nuclear transport factor 2 family protein [Microbulbifer sp. GL-2]|uniref:nuclear transport factor 2 family protein n=1 Tax=Microbulbifer sp. GL-2 TaxID=2591606 RepID=UPI00117C89C0|nr:nuclear transport factor 2 family protein [Microbulbifer sp. GL-2]
MNNILEEEIVEAEERLRLAMISSDLPILDQLLSENLIFTNHLGQRLSKSMDLVAHESGNLALSSIELSDQKILVSGDSLAVVSVKAKVDGIYSGESAGGCFAFTRVWSKVSGSWQVVAAHSGIIA